MNNENATKFHLARSCGFIVFFCNSREDNTFPVLREFRSRHFIVSRSKIIMDGSGPPSEHTEGL